MSMACRQHNRHQFSHCFIGARPVGAALTQVAIILLDNLSCELDKCLHSADGWRCACVLVSRYCEGGGGENSEEGVITA